MLKPLRPVNRIQKATSIPESAPVGGWNARDSLDSMQPGEAVVLDNWFPREGWVETRKGSALQCNTGETTAIGSLSVSNINGTENMLAGVNGKLIKTTTSSPSTIGSGFASNAWRSTSFRNKIFLVAAGNAPQDWDGTTLTSTSWSGSGLTVTDLFDVTVFKSRLYFLETNSASFWYGGTNAVTGTLTEFDLSGLGTAGGKLLGVTTITTDGGDGQSDLLVFFFTSGDVVVYAGSDPASNFSHVGTFRAGAIVATGACAKIGSSAYAITQDGFVDLSKIFPFGRLLGQGSTLSDKISYAASLAVQTYAGNNGWGITLFPKGDKLLFNVPRSTTRFDQYVMNVHTGAWCRFRGWNGSAWCIFNNNLYFGSTSGKVFQADTGTADDTSDIVFEAQTAWNYFGDRGRIKRWTMARPILQSPSMTNALMALGIDFNSIAPQNVLSTGGGSAIAIWDTAIWDQAVWADASHTSLSWQTVLGMGYCSSLRLRMSSRTQQVKWFSTNYTYEPGGVL